MRWIILGLGIALGILCLMTRRHFGSPGRLLFSYFPPSSRVRKKLLSRLAEAEPDSLLRPEERLAAHCAHKTDVLLGLTAVGLLLIFLFSFAGRDAQPVSSLALGEEAGSVIVSGGIAGQKAEELVVDLPKRPLSVKEKVLLLGEADRYISSYFGELGTLTAPPRLPEALGAARFSYYSLAGSVLDDKGVFLGEWPQNAYDAPFRVVVWVDDMKSAVDVELHFAPADELPLAAQWALIKNRLGAGRYTSGEELVLPEMTDGGQRLSWQIPSTRVSLWLLLLLLGLGIGLAAGRMDARLDEKTKARRAACEAEGPELVSEYLLYLGAGLSPQNAWLRVSDEYEAKRRAGGPKKALREEMKLESARLLSGFSFAEILADFAENSLSPDARRMARLLSEERSLGNRELTKELRRICEESWEQRRRKIKEKTEKADTRLLLPIMLMFCVILAITVAPALMNIKGL